MSNNMSGKSCIFLIIFHMTWQNVSLSQTVDSFIKCFSLTTTSPCSEKQVVGDDPLWWWRGHAPVTQTSLPSCQGRSASTWCYQCHVRQLFHFLLEMLNVHFNFTFHCYLSAWCRPQTRVWLCLWFRGEVRRIFYLYLLFKSSPALNITMI